MRINTAPVARGFHGKYDGASHEYKVFECADDVVSLFIPRAVDHDILPGDDHKQIQINPPAEDDRDIHVTVQGPAAIAEFVRQDCECSDHGDRVQEENNVANKWNWNTPLLVG